MKSFKYFSFEIQNQIIILHFNSPESSNAFGLPQALEFEEIIDIHIKKNKSLKGIILTSESKTFCSGGHLKNYSLLKKAEGLVVNKKISAILNWFCELPVPTIALVQGDVWGGGLEVLSAFDKVYTTPEAFFGMWQRKISLTWGWGGGKRLKKRIAKKQLLNLLMDAKTLSSLEALKLGLIDKIYPRELLTLKAFEYFKLQNKLPQAPLPLIKKEDFKNEHKIFKKLWWNQEHRNVLSRFIKKD